MNQISDWILFILLILFFSGCGDGVIRHVNDLPPPPQQTGFILFKKMQPEVRIYLNDRFRGQVRHYPKNAMLVEAGSYLLEFRLKGYASRYHKIKVQSHRPIRIQDHLILIPPRPTPQH